MEIDAYRNIIATAMEVISETRQVNKSLIESLDNVAKNLEELEKAIHNITRALFFIVYAFMAAIGFLANYIAVRDNVYPSYISAIIMLVLISPLYPQAKKIIDILIKPTS